ncbi:MULTISPECIES: hypothetical protein [Burkholderia]|uniref:hypothetical protein n=1 Tax=Burkholderia TaxID=32008 RepID=UPI000AE3BE83|nr:MULTISPECIES: hypothetical protein [Burkholderia]
MKSEFLESELELYVQRLLVHESYATGNLYRMLKISPSEERLKGYDAKIIGLTPFYCQFKTSDFLTKGPLYKRRQNFAAGKKWPLAPFYSFSLRVPSDSTEKKNSKAWQHNVLHHMWKLNPSAVAYVAPTFHTRMELDLHEPLTRRQCCALACTLMGCDNYSASSMISVRVADVNGQERCRLPIFSGLLSIPPHIQVKDLKHSYCFTTQSDITFHSNPESVDGGATLTEKLQTFARESIRQDRADSRPSESRMSVSHVRTLLGLDDNDNDFLESFLSFGLSRAGAELRGRQLASQTFDIETPWFQQHVALAAALKAFFDITTLGLLKLESK